MAAILTPPLSFLPSPFLSPLPPPPRPLPNAPSFPPCPHQSDRLQKMKKRNPSLHCCQNSLELGLESTIQRRCLARHILSLLVIGAASSAPAKGLEEEVPQLHFIPYKDDLDNFSLLVPPEWVKGEAKASGQRNVTAFFPANDSSTNVNLVITGLGADYTGLGSFGTVDAFAEKLVNSLDRSWKRPPGQAVKLINSTSKNGLYYVEYTVQRPGERKRCLLSAVGIGFNGWYNRLYTLTGQFWEEENDKYRAILEKAVSSFRIS